MLGSFGYMNGGLKLAKTRPDISIVHASGYMVAPNFSPFGARYYQGTYLMGMAAASLSKSKKLGCVGAFAIPELITSINAFTLGAQSVDPSIEVSVVWVNSWFNPASEQEAAKALLSQVSMSSSPTRRTRRRSSPWPRKPVPMSSTSIPR